jgi:hypothetical protein
VFGRFHDLVLVGRLTGSSHDKQVSILQRHRDRFGRGLILLWAKPEPSIVSWRVAQCQRKNGRVLDQMAFVVAMRANVVVVLRVVKNDQGSIAHTCAFADEERGVIPLSYLILGILQFIEKKRVTEAISPLLLNFLCFLCFLHFYCHQYCKKNYCDDTRINNHPICA